MTNIDVGPVSAIFRRKAIYHGIGLRGEFSGGSLLTVGGFIMGRRLEF
jgi:hypothetical protein